jgi:DtxR family transcriptional regulator, Mn-dependent transcriptional regulator
MTNVSKEDYLSIIFKHRDSNGEIKPNIIAEKLQISGAAVTDMLKKLAKDGHIVYKKYQAVKLTGSGADYAKNMVRRHRIWEVFLHQIVGMPWDKVHDEAHMLEHSSSDELIDRLEEMLNFPEYDPHGDPIPGKNGKMPKRISSIPLSELSEGESGKVVRVNDFDEKFLVYISEIGIKLNEDVLVDEKRDFDKSLKILINGESYNISEKLAQNVFIEKEKRKRLK